MNLTNQQKEIIYTQLDSNETEEYLMNLDVAFMSMICRLSDYESEIALSWFKHFDNVTNKRFLKYQIKDMRY